MIRTVLGVFGFTLLAAAAGAVESAQMSPQRIRAVWLLRTQPCNGGGGNAMGRHPDEKLIERHGSLTLRSVGVTYKLPYVRNVDEFVVKLYLNDRSRGVVDHYILIADEDLKPPFGAVVTTELPPASSNDEAAFQAVEYLQKSSAGAAFNTIRRRTLDDPKFGKGIEYVTSRRIGSHCFPTADYQFLPSESKDQTLGISRFFRRVAG